MKPAKLAMAVLAAGLLGPSLALGANATAAPIQTPATLPGSPSTADDRIALSAQGSTLTGTNGGGGGSATWLHNFDADTIAGIAVEHQVLSVSHWTFGSLTGAKTFGAGDERYTVAGEVHEGGGRDGRNNFKYSIAALGLTGTYFHRLSAQVEDKQVNVETTHGNLPKAGLSYLWNPHLQTQVSYSYSFGGNLGTRLTAARIDAYGGKLNYFAGGAWGTASPILLGVQTVLPPRPLREGYAGVSWPLPRLRSEVTFIADYLWLKGGTILDSSGETIVPNSTRWTGTLNYIFHIGHEGKSR